MFDVDEMEGQPLPRDAARMRFAYFVTERGWRAENPATPGEDHDVFDAHATHFTVARRGQVVGYMRSLPHASGVGWSLDRELRPMFTEAEYAAVVREGGVELSRRVVEPTLSLEERRVVVELLFKQFLSLARRRRYQHVYAVVEAKTLPMLARMFGLPLRPAHASPLVLPDRTEIVVGHASIADLLASLERLGLRDAYDAFARDARTRLA